MRPNWFKVIIIIAALWAVVGGSMWWLTGNVCPRYSQSEELAKIRQRDKDLDYVMFFLTKVAIPQQVKLDN